MKNPTVKAFLRMDGYGLVVTCPFCGEEHLHGWGFGGRQPDCSGANYIMVPLNEIVQYVNAIAHVNMSSENRNWVTQEEVLFVAGERFYANNGPGVCWHPEGPDWIGEAFGLSEDDRAASRLTAAAVYAERSALDSRYGYPDDQGDPRLDAALSLAKWGPLRLI